MIFYLKNSFYQNSTLKKVALYFLGMGGGDYCAVYVCSNDRRKPDKGFVMDYVGKLRWYGPKDQETISHLCLQSSVYSQVSVGLSVEPFGKMLGLKF